jgi:hypothetical protein
MLRALHVLIKLAAAAILLTLAVDWLAFHSGTEVADNVIKYYEQVRVPIEDAVPGIPLKEIVAALAGLGVLALLLPLPPKSAKKSFTFAGTHGDVIIELENIEPTLERVLMKMPEVKNINIRLEPSKKKDEYPALVNATAILEKKADDDARSITARVEHHLKIHADRFLGTNNCRVRLRVARWRMSMKTVKPEPLMLEAPEATPASAGGQAPVQSVVAAPIDPETPTMEIDTPTAGYSREG